MNREKELVKNTIVLGLGKFLPKAIAIITLPIITARLTKNEYGTFDLISTLIMLLLPVATLQIQSAAFRFLIDYRNDRYNSKIIITNIFVVTIPISVIVALLLGLFWKDNTIGIRILICLYLLCDIMYLTIAQIARGLSFNAEYSISSVLLSLINALMILFTLQMNNLGLIGAVLSLLVANIVAVIYLSLKIHIFSFIDIKLISIKKIKEMLSYSWPMVPNNLSNWVLKLSDRLVITAALGVEANAVYAVANKIPNLLSIAQSIFVMAWQENASITVGDKDADKYYSKMFKSVFSIMFGCTALLIGYTPIIFKILIRGDYSDAYIQMPILILGMFFYCMSSFWGGIYIAHKKTKNVGITTMVAAIINFALDVLLVNRLGITAGSLSTLIAYFVLYIYRVIDSKRFQKVDDQILMQVVLLITMVLMLSICAIQNPYLNLVNILLGTMLFLICNKEIIIKIIKKVVRK